jgi:hypothetical protein
MVVGHMLFNEVYGTYYDVVACVLKEAARGALTGKKLNDVVLERAFGESVLAIPEGLVGERWRLLHRDLSTSLAGEPHMPLTTLERRWLKAQLLDPRMRLFEPDMTGLEDVEPLYTPDMVVYYDRYTDGDDYEDPAYARRFGTILRAIREGHDLYVCFEPRVGEPLQLVVTPHHLEYSQKDDRFRLVAAGRRRCWTINLSRITECALAYEDRPKPLQETQKDTVTFELTDRRNAMRRVLLHFSHLERETKRLDNNTYRVTLKYDKQDETEMVIRILSFGPAIRVVEPQSFVALLGERVERQRRLASLS